MSVVRLIFVTVKPEEAAAAARVWKQDGAPLMIRQPGCQSEELLRSSEVKVENISCKIPDEGCNALTNIDLSSVQSVGYSRFSSWRACKMSTFCTAVYST